MASRSCTPAPRWFSVLALACLLALIACRAEHASSERQITYGTRFVLLESGIHWAEWVNKDGSDCGDVYKWNDQWMADTYLDGLSQRPFATKDEAVAWVQRWCK